MTERIICLLIGYICGLFQTGYLYSKYIKKIDITKMGSGNTGATNSLRTMGIRSGIIVFIGDFLKAYIPCLLTIRYFGGSGIAPVMALWMGLGVSLGHDYPCYLHFKGGKGIASIAGVGIAVNAPLALTVIGIFALVTAISGYVSLGSIIAMFSLIILMIVGAIIRIIPVQNPSMLEFAIMITIIAAIAIYRHKANIKRLISGTENRFGHQKK